MRTINRSQKSLDFRNATLKCWENETKKSRLQLWEDSRFLGEPAPSGNPEAQSLNCAEKHLGNIGMQFQQGFLPNLERLALTLDVDFDSPGGGFEESLLNQLDSKVAAI